MIIKHISIEKLKEIHFKTENPVLKFLNNDTYFCLDSCQLLLEVNSIHANLHLSEGNRTVTMKSEPKNYPAHPDRFDHWQQVGIHEGVE